MKTLSALTFVIMAFFLTTAPAVAESVLDRVMQTKTIRCGYLVYEPFVSMNLKTGDLSGIVVDFVERVAEKQGLKVDWAADINPDQIVPNLEHNRIDAFCVPVIPDDNWKKVMNFVGGFGTLPYFMYVSEANKDSPETIEKKRFVLTDGYHFSSVTQEVFPKAEYIGLPQMTSIAEMYDQIRYGKADAIVNEHVSAMNYMNNNPGILRKFSDEPVAVAKLLFGTRKDEQEMTDFVNKHFDASSTENSDLIDELTKKHDIGPDVLKF